MKWGEAKKVFKINLVSRWEVAKTKHERFRIAAVKASVGKNPKTLVLLCYLALTSDMWF